MKKRSKKIIHIIAPLCVILTFMLPLLLSTGMVASATTLYVDPSSRYHFQSIQAAIDAAKNGDTIEISKGVYPEALVISKSLSIRGENKNSTIITGKSTDCSVLINILADNVIIQGITVDSSSIPVYSCGILLNDTKNCTITNSTIKNCTQGLKIFEGATNSSIYQINFVNNSHHAFDEGENTSWDKGYSNGGNYWDTATGEDTHSGEHQNESKSDGIYDHPYILINMQSKDNYPFTTYDGWLNTPPIAHPGGPYINYVHTPIIFDGSQSYDTEGEVSYQWFFGDGTNSTGKYPQHYYENPGTYSVDVCVSDSHNVTKTKSTKAYIWNQTTGNTTLMPSHDSFLTCNNTQQNHTNKSYLCLSNRHGKNSSDWEHIPLICFNTSSFPETTIITQASLQLYYYDYDKTNPSGRILQLYQTPINWLTENVTWSQINDTKADLIDTASVPSNYEYMTWDVTSSVQQFVSDSKTNYGWHIRDSNAWNSIDIPVIKFKSKETITDYPPQLIIEYYTPLQVYTNGPYTQDINQPINLTGYHLGSGTPPFTWKWEFGDGASANTQSTQHRYDMPGHYTITLSITDSNGQHSTINTTATIQNNTVPPLELSVSTPKKGIYLDDHQLFPLRHTTLFIGTVSIKAEINRDPALIEKCEFYVDGNLVSTDTTALYETQFPTKVGMKKYSITITVYPIDAPAISQIFMISKIL